MSKEEKCMNREIREFMYNDVVSKEEVSAEKLVKTVAKKFPTASNKQIAGNLSAQCCYYRVLCCENGMVTLAV